MADRPVEQPEFTGAVALSFLHELLGFVVVEGDAAVAEEYRQWLPLIVEITHCLTQPALGEHALGGLAVESLPQLVHEGRTMLLAQGEHLVGTLAAR